MIENRDGINIASPVRPFSAINALVSVHQVETVTMSKAGLIARGFSG
jgi:hypothetical protein